MPYKLTGYAHMVGDEAVLWWGTALPATWPTPPLAGPTLQVAPGYHFYTRPTHLLPESIIDDLGALLPAPACYDWLETHGDLFPRADVVGRLPTGTPHTAFLKELDLTELAAFVQLSPTHWAHWTVAIEVVPLTGPTVWHPAPGPLPLLERATRSYRLAATAWPAFMAGHWQQVVAATFPQRPLTRAELETVGQ